MYNCNKNKKGGYQIVSGLQGKICEHGKAGIGRDFDGTAVGKCDGDDMERVIGG